MSSEVTDKLQELFVAGIEVGQRDVEMLTQLSDADAIDCCGSVLACKSSSDKTGLLRKYIDKKLCGDQGPSTADESEPATKKAKTS